MLGRRGPAPEQPPARDLVLPAVVRGPPVESISGGWVCKARHIEEGRGPHPYSRLEMSMRGPIGRRDDFPSKAFRARRCRAVAGLTRVAKTYRLPALPATSYYCIALASNSYAEIKARRRNQPTSRPRPPVYRFYSQDRA
ncbi:hypothetical protein ACLOJK_006050 [Asimina triloba]